MKHSVLDFNRVNCNILSNSESHSVDKFNRPYWEDLACVYSSPPYVLESKVVKIYHDEDARQLLHIKNRVITFVQMNDILDLFSNLTDLNTKENDN